LTDLDWRADSGMEVHVLDAHAVERSGAAHSGVAHHHDDVLERLLDHREQPPFRY